MTHFRPMLASSDIPTEADLRYPMLVSPKIDGIRCCIRDGVPLSRKLKPIPNRHVYRALQGLPNFDGELTVAQETSEHGFDSTQSAIMSEDGTPDFKYHVFDCTNESFLIGRPFRERLDFVHARAPMYGLTPLQHFNSACFEAFQDHEKLFLYQGYEGMMIRDPQGPYKFGRSTLKEGWLLKVVRKKRAEVIIVDFEERMHNENEKVTSELGTSKRSSHKANKTATGMLGKFVLQWFDPVTQALVTGKTKTFECGTGFSHTFAKHVWENQEAWRFLVITIEFRELTKENKPRFPVYIGRRDERDIGEPA